MAKIGSLFAPRKTSWTKTLQSTLTKNSQLF